MLIFTVLVACVASALSDDPQLRKAPAECADLGFTEDLLCTTCVRVHNVTGDEKLFSECKLCCRDTDVMQRVPKASLEVCFRSLRSFPDVCRDTPSAT